MASRPPPWRDVAGVGDVVEVRCRRRAPRRHKIRLSVALDQYLAASDLRDGSRRAPGPVPLIPAALTLPDRFAFRRRRPDPFADATPPSRAETLSRRVLSSQPATGRPWPSFACHPRSNHLRAVPKSYHAPLLAAVWSQAACPRTSVSHSEPTSTLRPWRDVGRSMGRGAAWTHPACCARVEPRIRCEEAWR